MFRHLQLTHAQHMCAAMCNKNYKSEFLVASGYRMETKRDTEKKLERSTLKEMLHC